jgi:hypothetical protein
MDRADLTARIAYALFEHRGRTHGQDQGDWFTAESFVALCVAESPVCRATKRALPASSPSQGLAAPDLERRSLQLLADVAEREGRASASAALGYASTSVVSGLLRGSRALDRGLAERILEAFGGEAAARPADAKLVVTGGARPELERRAG